MYCKTIFFLVNDTNHASDPLEYINHFMKEMDLNAFRGGIFPSLPTKGTVYSGMLASAANISDLSSLKILTPKQMFQKLAIALAQKVRNIYENLLNEIRQIIYFLYQTKEITENVYKNTMNSIMV